MATRAILSFLLVAAAAALHAPVPHLPRTPVRSAAVASRPLILRASAAAQPPKPALPLLAKLAKPWRSGASTAALSALLLLAGPTLALASGGATEHLHLGQKIALFFQKTGLPDWAVLVLISMTPAVELRGAVPVGNWMGLSPLVTFVICVIGNMLPIAPTLLALRSKFVKDLAKPLLERANKKLAGLPTGRSRELALALFVGVPAPGTGAWTGAIIAYLLDMPFWTAMVAILAGVLLAGVIMTVLTLAGKAGAIAALAVLLVGGFGAIKASASEGDEGGAEAA